MIDPLHQNKLEIHHPATTEKPRILFAWEHGRNLGHLVRLAEIANSVKTRAGTVIWAIPPQYAKHPILSQRNERIYVAPTFVKPVAHRTDSIKLGQHTRLHSFADILLTLGFGDTQTMGVTIAKWLRFLEAVQPSCLLCDYAPFAMLAAYALGIPVTQITNGFDAPPLDFPFFESDVYGPYLEQANARKVAQLNQSIISIGHALGAPKLDLAGLMTWPNIVIDGISETDPYNAIRKNTTYIGPFVQSNITCTPNWSERDESKNEKRIFVYLRGEKTIDALEALKSSNLTTLCLWPDAPASALKYFNNTAVQITQNSQNLPLLLSQVDAVINYGSSGFLNVTLLSGKPQLMLPTDREKLVFSRQIERLNAGIIGKTDQMSIKKAIHRLLDDSIFTSSAQRIAIRYKNKQLDHQRNRFLDHLMLEAKIHQSNNKNKIHKK